MNGIEQTLLEGGLQSGGRQILLVEDSPGDAAFVREFMTQPHGLENRITHATTLADAVVQLKALTFDAILLDLRLPDGVGVDCVRALRAVGGDVPIVVVTGIDDDSTAFACIAAGAQDYIPKAEIQAQTLNRSVSYAISRMGELVQRRRADELQMRLTAIVDTAGAAIAAMPADEGETTPSIYDATDPGGVSKGELDPESRSPDRRQAHMRNRQAATEEFLRRPNDRRAITMSAVATALRDTASQISEIAAICQNFSEQKRLNTEVERRNSELLLHDRKMRSLAAYLTNLLEEERTRIAREVHDGLGQLLTGLKMDLSWIARKLGPNIGTVRDRLSKAEALVDQTIVAAQGIAVGLRPSVLDTLGLAEAIRDEGRRFMARTGLLVTVDIRTRARAAEQTATTVFRIAQELMTNVGRHARASAVSIDLFDEGDELVMQLTDDGIGIDEHAAANATSPGLVGIHERAARINATFSIQRSAGGGTTATVRVPR
jgi:two-component system sensor histidine kinase UhpB